MTARPYVIRQGDYLTKLAFVMGFDADEVWNHPKNAELKARRANPNILYPGDILFVPNDPPTAAPLQVGAVNRYLGRIPTVVVRVTLLRADRTPIANTDCWIHGLGEVSAARSDADGTVSVSVLITVDDFIVVIDGEPAPLRVLVGHLDPKDEDSGVLQRLENLGYLPPMHPSFESFLSSEDIRQHHEYRLSNAVSRFQEEHGLPPTGSADEATIAALAAKHRA